jgi:hypothetical protein
MDHPGAENLKPAGTPTAPATLAAADTAANVNLETRFGEGEEARSEPDPSVGSKKPFGEMVQGPF